MTLAIMKIVTAGLIPILLTVLITILKKATSFNKINSWYQQLIIGSLFGISSFLATLLGINYEGMLMNIRDASPIAAGFIFGPAAGILAGLIGAIGRFVYSLYGAGTYSCIACCIACILAGFAAAAGKKWLMKGKGPSALIGFIIAVIVEIVHMLLILLTHLNDIEPAYRFVQSCAIPVITGNAIITVICIWLYNWIEHHQVFWKENSELSSSILLWCITCMFAGCLFSSILLYASQTMLIMDRMEKNLKTGIENVLPMVEEEQKKPLAEREMPSQIMISQNGPIMIIDSSMKIIADPFNRVGVSISPSAIADHQPYEIFQFEYNRENWFCMYAKAGDYYVLATIPYEVAMEGRMEYMLIALLFELLIFTLLFLGIYFVVRKFLINNLGEISKSFEKVIDGDLSVVVDDQEHKEFNTLAHDINSTVHQLNSYLEEIQNSKKLQETGSRRIIQNLNPSIHSVFNEVDEVEIYACHQQGAESAPSFIDFFMVPMNTICMITASADNPALEQSINLMELSRWIRDSLTYGHSLAYTVKMVNEKLTEAGTGPVRVWIGLLNYLTGKLEYVCAGHITPFITRLDEQYPWGIPVGYNLGESDDVRFQTFTKQLMPGSQILLFSDGAVECSNSNGEQYGVQNLKNSFMMEDRSSSKDLITNITNDLSLYCSLQNKKTGYSIAALKIQCIRSDSSITVVANEDSVDRAHDFAIKKSKELMLSSADLDHLNQILDLTIGDLLKFSNPDYIEITIQRDEKSCEVRIKDNGMITDWMTLIGIDSKEVHPGRLNLTLIKRYADISCSIHEGNSEICFVFDLEKDPVVNSDSDC